MTLTNKKHQIWWILITCYNFTNLNEIERNLMVFLNECANILFDNTYSSIWGLVSHLLALPRKYVPFSQKCAHLLCAVLTHVFCESIRYNMCTIFDIFTNTCPKTLKMEYELVGRWSCLAQRQKSWSQMQPNLEVKGGPKAKSTEMIKKTPHEKTTKKTCSHM